MAVRSPDGWTQQVAARTVSSVGRRRRPAIARGRIDSRRRHRCQNSLPACSYRPHWGAQRWHRRRRRMRRETSKIQRPRAPQVLIVHPAKLALLPAQERRARLLKPREARRGPAATKIRNTRARQAPSAEGPGRPDGLYGERRIARLYQRPSVLTRWRFPSRRWLQATGLCFTPATESGMACASRCARADPPPGRKSHPLTNGPGAHSLTPREAWLANAASTLLSRTKPPSSKTSQHLRRPRAGRAAEADWD